MSNDLPARYRRHSTAPNGNELVNCRDCANANQVPAAVIPRSAIPEHELLHERANAGPPAPRSAPWPELGTEQPVASGGEPPADVVNVPLTRAQIVKLKSGDVVPVRVEEMYDVTLGQQVKRLPFVILLRLADDPEIQVREMREPPYDTAPDGPLTVDDLPGGVNNPHPGVPASPHAEEGK